MPVCPNCGSSVEEGARFCPSCGQALLIGPHEVSPPRAAGFSETDRIALTKIRLFAIIGIIWIILGVIVPLFGGETSLLMSGLSGGFGNRGAGFGILSAIVGIVGFILGIYAIIKARSAFRDLSLLDRGFRTPTRLMTALFIGLGLFILAFILIITGIAVGAAEAITRAGSGSFVIGPAIGLFIGGGVLAIVAGIAVLIGIIGMIIGLWRTGERYDSTLIKVGGILYIIPVVDIVAPILVYLGVSEVQRRMPLSTLSQPPSSSSPTSSGAPPPPPPPSNPP